MRYLVLAVVSEEVKDGGATSGKDQGKGEKARKVEAGTRDRELPSPPCPSQHMFSLHIQKLDPNLKKSYKLEIPDVAGRDFVYQSSMDLSV